MALKKYHEDDAELIELIDSRIKNYFKDTMHERSIEEQRRWKVIEDLRKKEKKSKLFGWMFKK